MGQKQASAEAARAFTARVEYRRAVVVNEAAENKARANRERRLRAALRENLKRRKVQARARSLDTRTSDAQRLTILPEFARKIRKKLRPLGWGYRPAPSCLAFCAAPHVPVQ